MRVEQRCRKRDIRVVTSPQQLVEDFARRMFFDPPTSLDGARELVADIARRAAAAERDVIAIDLALLRLERASLAHALHVQRSREALPEQQRP